MEESKMISWIPEGHSAVIEYFGRFSHVQKPGFYFYIPVIYTTKDLPSWGRVANKSGYLIEQSEQQTSTPTRYCQTKDNVTVKANTSIGWQIVDPKKAVYATDRLPSMIADLALNSLRASVGTLSLHEVFSSRDELNKKINSDLAETVNNWGIKLTRVEIQELTYTDEIAKAMMAKMVAEQKRQADIAQAMGKSEAELISAKADAQAIELSAQAQANATLITAEASSKAMELKAESEKIYLMKLKEEVGTEFAAQILSAEKQREGLESITKNPAHKVFLTPQTQQISITNA